MTEVEEDEFYLEEIEDTTAPIEKPKRPHALKGKAPSESQKANLLKGRDQAKAKKKVKDLENAVALVKGAGMDALLPPVPPVPPKKDKKKSRIVIQTQSSDDDSDNEPPQIVIRNNRKRTIEKPRPPTPPAPEPELFEPAPQAFRLKRTW